MELLLDKRKVLITSLICYLLLILIIQAAAIGFATESLPEECSEGSMNCVHSSLETSYRTNLNPLVIEGSKESVMAEVLEWEESLWFSRLVESDKNQLYIVHRTPLMQFPDDVFIRVECVGDKVAVTFHSQSRLGLGDMNKNIDRFSDFHTHMSGAEYTGSCNQ